MKQNKPCKSGFTLLELLVAVALMLILVVAVVTVFNQASEVFTISESKMELFQNVRIGLDQMSRELASANNDRRNFRIQNPTDDTQDLVILEFDTITSWLDSNQTESSGQEITDDGVHNNEEAKVRYLISNDPNANEGRWTIFRQVFTADPENSNDPNADVPATEQEVVTQFIQPDPDNENIPNIRIGFIRFEGGNWQYIEPPGEDPDVDPNPKIFDESNAQNRMPHAIRITAEFAPRERDIFRTISRNFWIAGAESSN